MADLREAATAVLARWDSPQWEWSIHGPTADLMHALRAALAQPDAPDAMPTDGVCKGAWALGTACGTCSKCLATKPDAQPVAWQPIETAPKDGTKILVYCPWLGVCGPAEWDICQHAKKPRPFWTHWGERIWGASRVRIDQPTHWMPLPSAPGAAQAAQPEPSTAPNLSCKSVQARLAEQWGYVRAQPAPQPLSEDQIEGGHILYGLRKGHYKGPSQLCDAFTNGVHFAEEAHGITAAPTTGEPTP